MNLIASTSTFSFFTLISRILGYVRDILIAIFLGTSLFADAFFVAFRLPNTFRRLFAEGTFNAAFIPSYAGELAQNKEHADYFARNVFNLLFIILLFLVLLAEIFIARKLAGVGRFSVGHCTPPPLRRVRGGAAMMPHHELEGAPIGERFDHRWQRHPGGGVQPHHGRAADVLHALREDVRSQKTHQHSYRSCRNNKRFEFHDPLLSMNLNHTDSLNNGTADSHFYCWPVHRYRKGHNHTIPLIGKRENSDNVPLST